LNYRPPAYQADALTGLSYRPEALEPGPTDWSGAPERFAGSTDTIGPRKTNNVRRQIREPVERSPD
jgi:hypothetical protein